MTYDIKFHRLVQDMKLLGRYTQIRYPSNTLFALKSLQKSLPSPMNSFSIEDLFIGVDALLHSPLPPFLALSSSGLRKFYVLR